MNRHRLFHSKTSPYARKVLVFAIETNQASDLELIETDVWISNPEHVGANPLGKVPTLVTPQGQVIFDSLVICEYLDRRHSFDSLLPLSGKERWEILTRHALAQGIMDASLTRRWEYKFRPAEQQSEYWMQRQQAAITRAMSQFDAGELPRLDRFGIDGAALACALSYIDMRCDLLRLDHAWRAAFPKLAEWHRTATQRVSMQQTEAG